MADIRARTHIKTLADEIQGFLNASPDDKSEGAVFMTGAVNGLAIAVRILDGATAEEAFEALETQIATALGRLYLGGKLNLTPPQNADATEPEPPCPNFSEHGWGGCVEPRGHAGQHMYRTLRRKD